MSEDTDDVAGEEQDDYEWMVDQLDEAIAEARRKVESGRVYDAENEEVRIKWIRALAYAVNVRRQITNDQERAEVEERLEVLEELQGVEP